MKSITVGSCVRHKNPYLFESARIVKNISFTKKEALIYNIAIDINEWLPLGNLEEYYIRSPNIQIIHIYRKIMWNIKNYFTKIKEGRKCI